MKFQLIDKIIAYEKNKRICGLKVIGLTDNGAAPFSDRRKLCPATLCMESIAQSGWWLTFASLDFRRIPVLGMISNARIYCGVLEGDEYRIEATVVGRQDDYSIVSGQIDINGKVCIDVQRITYGLIHAERQDMLTYQMLFKALLEKQG
jgi:3-hydroxymyristoyl/3-hydroxydecanoyl-(acyl carrier protein) dehydratase